MERDIVTGHHKEHGTTTQLLKTNATAEKHGTDTHPLNTNGQDGTLLDRSKGVIDGWEAYSMAILRASIFWTECVETFQGVDAMLADDVPDPDRIDLLLGFACRSGSGTSKSIYRSN
jgi:hypothetical protein